MADSGEKKKEGAEQESTAVDSTWKGRARRFAFWLIVVELVAFVLFFIVLAIGESSRMTMLALYAPRQPFLAVAIAGAILSAFTRRRVRVLVGVHVVLALIVLFPVMGLHLNSSRATSTGSAAKAIHLASYNIYFGKLGRPRLLEEIAAMQADIVLLQATYDSLGDMQERFPDRSTNRVDDFVIISRFKILKVEEPPPLADGELPKFVGYLLETPSGPLRVYNIHPFSPRHALFEDDDTKDNLKHREAQVEAVVWAATTAQATDGAPFVIVGDTNLPPGSGIARRHLGRFKDAFEEVGFGLGYTFPAKRPWMRIDRAFADDKLIRFLDARTGALGASDHRPIFIDFELK